MARSTLTIQLNDGSSVSRTITYTRTGGEKDGQLDQTERDEIRASANAIKGEFGDKIKSATVSAEGDSFSLGWGSTSEPAPAKEPKGDSAEGDSPKGTDPKPTPKPAPKPAGNGQPTPRPADKEPAAVLQSGHVQIKVGEEKHSFPFKHDDPVDDKISPEEAARLWKEIKSDPGYRSHKSAFLNGPLMFDDKVVKNEDGSDMTLRDLRTMASKAKKSEASDDTAGGVSDDDAEAALLDVIENSNTQEVVRKLRQKIRELRLKDKQIERILMRLMAGGPLNWRTFLAVMNLFSLKQQLIANESAASVLQIHMQDSDKLVAINQEIAELSSDDENYASQLRSKTFEMSQIQGRQTAALNFLRDNKSAADSAMNVAKSLGDITYAEERGRSRFSS